MERASDCMYSACNFLQKLLKHYGHFKLSGNRESLLQFIEQVQEGVNKGKYQCTMCGKVSGQKIHTINHLESIHFPGTFEHKCKYCDTVFHSRNLMYMHINKVHKGETY